MTDFPTILSSVGGSGLLIWLTKTWISERLKNAIKAEYDEKLETHKAKLKAVHETEIERLRADLRVAAHEKEIRLTKLHEKTADTIARTYALLHEVEVSVRRYTKILGDLGDSPRAERREAFNRAVNEFDAYFKPHRIWLPIETAKKIEEFVDELHGISLSFFQEVEQGGSSKHWIKTIEDLILKAGPLRTSLESEFRRLLGRTDEDVKPLNPVHIQSESRQIP